MPVTIKQSNMKYRATNGEYIGVNSVAERATSEQVDEIEAIGAETISEVQSVLTEVETQKDAMIASMMSVAQMGVDATLSQLGVPADASACGEVKNVLSELRNLFRVEYTDAISVVSGGLHGTDGTSFTTSSRCRTTYNTLQPGYMYFCSMDNTGYKIKNAFLYNPQGIGQRIAVAGEHFFICCPTNERNRLRMSFANSADESAEITETDITTISNAISVHSLLDESLTIDNALANAKSVGDKINLFESSTEYINKFYFNLGETPDTTIKGITYSIDADGVLTLNGTPTENTYFQIMGGDRKTNVRNLAAGKAVILKRELISGTATGFPVFRNTYDYATSAEGTAIVVDTPFIPTSDGCLFLRLTNTTSFVNAKYRFMVIEGSVAVPYVKRTKTADDVYFRQKFELSEKNKLIFDSAIKSKNRMLFSAHRGAEGQAPYGSYPSYELACQQGWDLIQIAQARQSADGTWYCLHDSTVDAQTNGTGSIASLTDAYMSSIYQDTGVNIDQYTQEQLRIPTLESVLKLAYRYGAMVSIRMGSLPALPGTGEIPAAWTSFIDLCKKYRPERMMFSGNMNQVKALKALTPNWHGQVYVTDNTILSIKDQFLQNEYTNMSILGINTYVTESIINAIHDAGYYYAMAQIDNPTLDAFIGFSDMHVDISQTGISSIHSISGT